MSKVLSFFEPVILIGGGPVSPDDVALVQRFASKTIAADSGADTADALGLDVYAVLGDMDSVSAAGLLRNDGKITEIAEQETTDFEKCVYASEAPLYLCVGFLGGRLDHELAALNVLAKYAQRRIILIGSQDVIMLCPKEITLELPLNTRVSLFPFGAVSGAESKGLRWPLNGCELSSDGHIGVSNSASKSAVEISYNSGTMLLILPVENLPELLASF